MMVKSEPARRGAARTAAIVAAALELLREVGYEQLSIDAVAARVGASKTTIYRRWPDKSALVRDVLLTRVREPGVEPPPIARDLRADLRGLVRFMARLVSAGDTVAFASVLSAARTDPALAQVVRVTVPEHGRQYCRDVVQRAIGRGELTEPRLADTLFELVVGHLMARRLLLDLPFDDTEQDTFVDTVLWPVLTAAGGTG